MYEVIALPLLLGAVQLTIAWLEAGMADTPVGTAGRLRAGRRHRVRRIRSWVPHRSGWTPAP